MTTAAPQDEHDLLGPVLRWSGSKARLVSILEANAPASFGHYLEPFVGSACLYFKIRPLAAVLGDINPAVMEVYEAIRTTPQVVHSYLASIPSTAEAYYTLREVDRTKLTLEQRAAQTIFLMKACFNGVYRTNKSGRFNVPMGSRIYAIPTLDQLIQVSKLLEQATLMSGDFENVLLRANPGDFVYLDPPYPSANRYRGEYGYSGRFGANDKSRLIEAVQLLDRKGVKVMISYVHDEELVGELPNWLCRHESVRRSVAGNAKFRLTTNEIILTNYSAKS